MIRSAVLLLPLLTAVTIAQGGLETSVTLKEAAGKRFTIGAALNKAEFTEEDKAGAELAKRQFNTISLENILKWKHVQPTRNVYTFKLADKFVEFNEKNHMEIIGHTLVWHNQTPKWVFQNDDGSTVSRDALLDRIREHILKVVGRYNGRIKGWDILLRACPLISGIGDTATCTVDHKGPP